jgi:BirA family biotin operon repressor/biotin-[acetyl-CoA-carboxylase] ligase
MSDAPLATAEAPLRLEQILSALAAGPRARLRHGEVVASLDSTNAALLARSPPAVGQFDFLLAEFQSAGRGRRSRPWLAPPGGALCLSLGWSCATLPRELPALSLAMGVCALRALARMGLPPAQLKWPNDLWAQGRKLGGILIELRAENSGAAHVVIGIGINCALGAEGTQRVAETGTQPIDLATLQGFANPAIPCAPRCDRNLLAAALLGECVPGILEFERSGLASFAAEWRAADALAGRPVSVTAPGGKISGHARGIDADGALCVQGASGLLRFNSGEVSVRAET